MGAEKSEFWESSFKDKQSMWGFEPAHSAKLALELFKQQHLNSILIPGFGYGRNGQLFYKHGLTVTGIEISKTAIELAKKHYDECMTIYHGNVLDMPFDSQSYGGIFCYALIHLLDEPDRKKLIQACYQQLKPKGYMVFVTLSKNTATYGEGIEISKDRFTTKHGVNLFYYDESSIKHEFAPYGWRETRQIEEGSQAFSIVICKKEA